MPLETWFPLAIYYEDLPEASHHKTALLEAVADLRAAALPRDLTGAAWTGDLHGVQRIHADPRFAWVTQLVQRHARRYLRALGYRLDRMSLFFQRSWPVVARAGEWVSRHSHPAANLSAAYYVQCPPGSGALSFWDQAWQNECGPGHYTRSGDLLDPNPLNYASATYAPVEGRLVFFPAKTPHSVAAGVNAAERISLSYDIMFTMHESERSARYEFMMPPPGAWQRFSDEPAPDGSP